MTEQIGLRPRTIQLPCVRGFYGRHICTYQTQSRPDELVAILGHDPRPERWSGLAPDIRTLYEELQRHTSDERREGIAEYIEEQMGPTAVKIGAFPAISLGMRKPANFVPINGDDSFGILHLELGDINRPIVLDGLGRVTGALDLIEDSADSVGNWFSFPVTFYAPISTGVLTTEQLGQLFHDFNYRVTPITDAHALALDSQDPYIQLANRLGASEAITKFGGMEKKAASLGKKSVALVVQKVLVRFVRGACEGREFQESGLSRVETPQLTPVTTPAIEGALDTFITELAQRMGYARFTDRDSLHLTAPGWQVLGLIFHELYFHHTLTADEENGVLQRLADIDWSRFNQDWIGLIGRPQVMPRTQQPILDDQGRQRVALNGAGRSTIAALLTYVRRRVGFLGPVPVEGAQLRADLDQIIDPALVPASA